MRFPGKNRGGALALQGRPHRCTVLTRDADPLLQRFIRPRIRENTGRYLAHFPADAQLKTLREELLQHQRSRGRERRERGRVREHPGSARVHVESFRCDPAVGADDLIGTGEVCRVRRMNEPARGDVRCPQPVTEQPYGTREHEFPRRRLDRPDRHDLERGTARVLPAGGCNHRWHKGHENR